MEVGEKAYSAANNENPENGEDVIRLKRISQQRSKVKIQHQRYFLAINWIDNNGVKYLAA